MFRPHDDGRREEAKLEPFPLSERILVALAQQPWASARDLAKRLRVAAPEVYGACHQLEATEGNRRIAGRDLGVTRRAERRYVLSRRGVRHVTRPFRYSGLVRPALPRTWQMTEEAVTRMLSWLPMIESLYEILPTFWTSGLIEPFPSMSFQSDPGSSSQAWEGVPTLVEVRWLPRGRLHAVATWSLERNGGRPRNYSVPFYVAGLLPQGDFQARSLGLGSQFRSPRQPEDGTSMDMGPPVVAIGLDRFAACRARAVYGGDVSVGAVDATGARVWSAEASHGEWTLRDRPPRARTIGHPEAAAIAEGPDIVNLGGVRDYRVVCFVANFRGAAKAHLRKALGMSGRSVAAAVNRLEARELIGYSGKNIYLTERGLRMLADRDRVDFGRLVKVAHLHPEGEAAAREREHDSAVAAVAARWRGAGHEVAAGWRWVVACDGAQLVPDLWVLLPVPGPEEDIWVPVEVESSAHGKAWVEEQLRSYRPVTDRLDQSFPMLVITGEPLPAQRSDDMAGDLPRLATTLKEFLTGVWEGPESVWRRRGRPAGLSDLAREYCGHPWQQTGTFLDQGQPSPEAPPTPLPGPVRRVRTARRRGRSPSHLSGSIDSLMETADSRARLRLGAADLTPEERLCLRRVRAIITYGRRRSDADERLVEQALRSCLELSGEHRRAMRSRNPLWLIAASRRKTSPPQAFRDLLKDHSHIRHYAYRRFNDWFRQVNGAGRALRQDRTLR